MAETRYERGVWYDFSQDRQQPVAVARLWQRDEAAIRQRERRLAEMQDREQARGRVLPLIRRSR